MVKEIPANKIVSIRIDIDEIELRQKVKMLGGRWNSKEKVWKIAYGKVKILNLEERIVEETEKKQVKKNVSIIRNMLYLY